MNQNKACLSFSKNESLLLKGVLIILMVVHHLFSHSTTPELIGHSLWWVIGGFGKICVAAYAFVSGYGLFVSLNNQKGTNIKSIASRILKLLVRYWICLSLILLIDILCGSFVFSLSSFAKVALCYSGLFFQYDANAWFILPYFCFVVLFSLMFNLIAKIGNKILRLLVDFSLIILPLGIAIISFIFVGEIGHVYNTLMYTVLFMLPFFYMGSLFAKYGYFTRIRYFRNSILNIFVGICLLAVSYILRNVWVIWVYGINAADLFIAPILITAILFIFKGIKIDCVNKVLFKIGKMSTNIWLIHYVFCQGSLLFFVTYFKYAILAFIVVMLLCVAASYIVDFIYSLLDRRINAP